MSALQNSYDEGYEDGWQDCFERHDYEDHNKLKVLYEHISTFVLLNGTDESRRLIEFLRFSPKIDGRRLPHPASVRKI